MRSFSTWKSARLPSGVPLVLVLGSLFGASACTGTDGSGGPAGFAVQAEAVLLWVEGDSASLPTHLAADTKAESRTAVWIADQITGGVFRVDPSRLDYRTMGAADTPPAEIVQPLRIAFSPEFGLFVFDQVSRRVDQFTPDGTPIRSFEPELVPSRMDVVRRPIGIQFAVVEMERADSTPRLVVIRTDLRGEQPDTVLYPGAYGPETLWAATARQGHLAVDAGAAGLWVWARTAPDTVFEVTPAPEARKRVLRPQDQDPVGILVDSEREILWVVSPGDADRLRYAAYDLRSESLTGLESSFLGERTTSGFDPVAATDGAIIGRTSSIGSIPKLAAYDMLAPLDR